MLIIDQLTVKYHSEKLINLDVDMTTLALPMISLIPEEVEKELRDIVSDDYCNLKELERIVLVLAHRFGKIGNSDIQHYSEKHPRDIGDCLKNLVDKGWLKKSGHGRGTNYALPNLSPSLQIQSDQQSSEHLGEDSEHFRESSEHLREDSEHYQRLLEIAKPVRDKKKVKDKELVKEIILEICSEHFLPLQTIADILKRKRDSIRNHYINQMLENELLEAKYPNHPNHPNQAYKKKSF